MQKLLTKVAPLGVMTACAIWCCWAQLREATPLLAATEAKLPRIERKLLHPEMSALAERDPFLQHKPEQTAPAEQPEAAATVVEEPPFDPKTLLPSIRLDATILGANRLVVINGKIHREGDIVAIEAAPEIPIRIDRVATDEIVVTILEETFHIGHSRKTKAVVSPAAETAAAAQVPEEFEVEVSAGTPSPDELDLAVAEALTQQSPTEDDVSGPEEADDLEAPDTHEDEDCVFEQELPITDIYDELFNNVE